MAALLPQEGLVGTGAFSPDRAQPVRGLSAGSVHFSVLSDGRQERQEDWRLGGGGRLKSL